MSCAIWIDVATCTTGTAGLSQCDRCAARRGKEVVPRQCFVQSSAAQPAVNAASRVSAWTRENSNETLRLGTRGRGGGQLAHIRAIGYEKQ